MTYDPTRHHRRSIRLRGFDYRAAGAYMITINTHQRAPLFGAVADGVMRLSPAGECVLAQWRTLPEHFRYVDLDAHVIMPDHMHGIVWISRDVLAEHDGAGYRDNGTTPDSLSALVQNFKSVTARKIKTLCPDIATVWQRGFYESVIRTERDLNNRREYIRDNPADWNR